MRPSRTTVVMTVLVALALSLRADAVFGQQRLRRSIAWSSDRHDDVVLPCRADQARNQSRGLGQRTLEGARQAEYSYQ